MAWLEYVANRTMAFIPDNSEVKDIYQDCRNMSQKDKRFAERSKACALGFLPSAFALGSAAEYGAKALLCPVKDLVRGRVKEMASTFMTHGKSAMQALALLITSLATAILGLAYGHDIYQNFEFKVPESTKVEIPLVSNDAQKFEQSEAKIRELLLQYTELEKSKYDNENKFKVESQKWGEEITNLEKKDRRYE